MNCTKKIILSIILLLAYSSYSQHSKNDFFGKWGVLKIEDLKIDTNEDSLRKQALKILIDEKFENQNYYIVINKKEIEFLENDKVTESFIIKKRKFKKNYLSLIFGNYDKKIFFTSNNESEMKDDKVVHYFKKSCCF